jgi:hypothetical protein
VSPDGSLARPVHRDQRARVVGAVTAMTDVVRELAVLEPGAPVLSVYVRTDPRDPANTAQTPAWLVELRNGLREAARAVEASRERDDSPALRQLSARLERDVIALDPAARARGLAWFVTADAALDRRLSLQIPPREHVVRWDARPFVSPLVDVADRGRPTGFVLVAAEAVRLLHWEGGEVAEPERSLLELEVGEWRDYSAYAMANPGRGPSSGHVATFEQRVAEWRQRFLRDAANAVGARLHELGWERVVLAGESRAATMLAEALPDAVRERVVGEVDANLLWQEPAAVAQRLEAELEAAWRRDARGLADRAVHAARAGGPGAIGWDEVLDTLIQQRVAHLVFAVGASTAPERLAPPIVDALGRPSRDLLVERAVERAIA